MIIKLDNNGETIFTSSTYKHNMDKTYIENTAKLFTLFGSMVQSGCLHFKCFIGEIIPPHELQQMQSQVVLRPFFIILK